MAVPTTSAMSVAMMATSAKSQRIQATGRGKASRQACARSLPDPIASREQRDCRMMAMMLDISATVSSA